eukprot:7993758-Ditylum_brightwellii.AAC.1
MVAVGAIVIAYSAGGAIIATGGGVGIGGYNIWVGIGAQVGTRGDFGMFIGEGGGSGEGGTTIG